MEIGKKLLFANVMHKRKFPKENSFRYRVYYLVFDIDKVEELEDGRWMGLNRWGLASFHEKDHGACDGSSLRKWADVLVQRYAEGLGISRIVLVAMPRILGYGINPVSFWLCLDQDENLRAVISEVHNTFGERHVYFCRNDDGSEIAPANKITTEKLFHVSPFLERNGHYSFRFELKEDRFGVWIDYFDSSGRKQLLTSLRGGFRENTRIERLKAFVSCPLVTLKTLTMIHWQALKLVLKGIQYIPKPAQLAERVVLSRKITNN